MFESIGEVRGCFIPSVTILDFSFAIFFDQFLRTTSLPVIGSCTVKSEGSWL